MKWAILYVFSTYIMLSSALNFNSIQEYILSFEDLQEDKSATVNETFKDSPNESVSPLFKTSPLLSMFPGSPPHVDFNSSNVGDPLILTPLIENGNLDDARNLSILDARFSDIVSYTGFFTVNKKYNSNLFFWYVPAQVTQNTKSNTKNPLFKLTRSCISIRNK